MGIRSFAACFRNFASKSIGSLSSVTGIIRAAIFLGLLLSCPLFYSDKFIPLELVVNRILQPHGDFWTWALTAKEKVTNGGLVHTNHFGELAL